MELVSVIVPIYNTEKYIEHCIESILNQTYKDIQLILIDDGSTDQSYKLCKKYAEMDNRVELYQQDNQGVSAARNLGLDHVNGKYCFFVDADDYIQPQYIEKFVNLEDYDFVGGGYTENNEGKWQLKYKKCVMTMEEYKRNLKTSFQQIPSVHVIENRYVSKIIKDNGLRFKIGCTCGEDVRFNVDYFSCINTLMAIDFCDYMYTIHNDSATHQYWDNRLEEERGECQAREKLLGESKDFDMIKYIHWFIALDHFYSFSSRDNCHRKNANKNLRKAIGDEYFLKCLPYVMKNGTKDMKIFVICIKLHSFKLYKFVISVIKRIKKLYDCV